MNCLTAEILERYICDQVSEVELAAIERHVKACRKCADRVAEALENESMLSEIRTLQSKTAVLAPREPGQAARVDSIENAQALLGRRYRVVKKVGTGGAGEVFQAVDAILERPVAIKFLRQTAAPKGRNTNRWNEAKLMGQFNHVNIAHVHEIGLNQGWRFIVMEWVAGVPLTEAWAGLGRELRLKLFLDVLAAVAAAHRRGIVHRDLKPSNILVTTDHQIKILDFGIALAIDTPGAVEKRVYRGTPAYSAPEQISSPEQISPATDVFALGILLYQLLTDTLPFPQTQTKEVFRAILLKHPELPNAIRDDLPLPLQNICLRALEKDPAKRYANAQALADDINRFLRGEIVWSRPSFLADKVQQEVYYHRQKLRSWYDNELITQGEFDRLEDIYERMTSPPDPSIIEARRLSLSQVCLYLGGWIAILGSFVLFYDAWEQIARPWRPTPAIGAAGLMTLFGGLLWTRNESRLSVGFLATANLLVPLAVLLALGHWNVYSPAEYPWGKELGLSVHSTLIIGNAQLCIAACGWLVCSLLFMKLTRSSAFALCAVIAFLTLLTVFYVIAGLRDWDPETIAGRYLWPGVVFFVFGMILDRRGHTLYAWPLSVVGILVLIAALSFIAASKSTLFGWLGYDPDFLNAPERLGLSFVLNGLIYLLLAGLCRRAGTRLQRRIAVFLNWLGPAHVMAPLRLLDAPGLAHREIYRVALPVAATAFVLGSVIRQMKSFFFSGLAGLAVAVHVFTEEYFRRMFSWPIALVVTGILWMFISWLVPRARAARALKGKE